MINSTDSRKRARHGASKDLNVFVSPECNLFELLPDVCTFAVVAHLMPFDVFNWCQTCSHYHRSRTRIVRQEDSCEFSSNATRERALAKQMMNASLTDSLDRVLKSNNIGFQISDLKRLNRNVKEELLPSSSIALSGSIVLQACLGKTFGLGTTDADMFCSQEAIYVARKWLVSKKSCDMVLHRLKDRQYVSNVDTYLSKETNQDRIHHVEAYGPMPSTDEMKLNGVSVSHDHLSFNRSVWKLKERQRSVANLPQKTKSPPYPGYDFTPGVGYKHSHLVFETRDHDSIGSDDESSYCAEYPDTLLDCTVDLVVGSENSTAFDLIESFDLDVCMCSYDGQTFRIKNPSFVFNSLECGGKLVSFPISNIVRNASVLEEFFVGWSTEQTTEERVRNLQRFDEKFNLIQFLGDERETIQEYNSRIRDIHYFVLRAVERINKYRRRGISILDSEHIPSEYPFHAFSHDSLLF